MMAKKTSTNSLFVKKTLSPPSASASECNYAGSISCTAAAVRLHDAHVKALRRFRSILAKDLDPNEILDVMFASDDSLRIDFARESIVGHQKTVEDTTLTLLDRLEKGDARTFAAFMDALHDRYRHLHSLLDEMIRTCDSDDDDDDDKFRERSALAGDVLRKLLKNTASGRRSNINSGRRRHPTSGSHGTGNESASNPSLNNPEGADGMLKKNDEEEEEEKEEDYLNCYVVSTKGRLQREKWMKHCDVRKEEEDNPMEPSTWKTYMAVMTKDLVFRRTEMSLIPDLVKQPPAHCQQVYVIDEESTYSPVSAAAPATASSESCDAEMKRCTRDGMHRNLSMRSRKSHAAGQLARSPKCNKALNRCHRSDDEWDQSREGDSGCDRGFRGDSGRRVKRADGWRDQSPPPLPPKPDNLPHLNFFPSDGGGGKKAPEMPVKGHDVSPSANTLPPLVSDNLNETLTPNDLQVTPFPESPLPAPPLPIRSRQENKKKIDDLSSPKPNDVILPQKSPYGNRNGFPEEEDTEEEGDELSLNYNIKPEEEGEDVEEEEDPYEDVTPQDRSSSAMIQSTSAITGTVADRKPSDGVENETDTDTICSNATLRGEPIRPEGRMSYSEVRTSSRTEAPVSVSGRVSPESILGGKGNARDSGVDSVVSQGFLDSPFSMDAAEPDVFSSCNLGDLKVMTLTDDEKSSTDFSYYEDIDLLERRHSPSVYLDPCSTDPRSNPRNTPYGYEYHSSFPGTSPNKKVLLTGSLLIVEMDDACLLNVNLTSFPEFADPTSGFNGTVLGFDKEGVAYYIPSEALKKYGDPENEDWFYPIQLTAKEATLFLNRENQNGCFLVYRPRNNNSTKALYNLSVCHSNGCIVHYNIVENIRGDVMIDGHDHSFMTVCDLVSYFRRNQSHLATRLRRPLKAARMPITPGHHYPEKLEIPRSRIELAVTTAAVTVPRGQYGGAVCTGRYNGMPVVVKVLQTDATSTEEDDFLEEVLVLMDLKHENIVRLMGVAFRTKPFYIVTEFFERGTLIDCLQNDSIRSDNVEDLFDVCMQIATALVYLETRRLVLHRTLAAKHFYVTKDMIVKLAHFERAHYVTDDNYMACPEEEVHVRWAAPEVLSQSSYSTKSDVWAMGVVFWEVFSRGAPPYAKLCDEDAAIFVVEGGRLERPSQCTHDLFSLMKSCWKRSPEDRPSQTAVHNKIKGKSSVYYATPNFHSPNNSIQTTTSVGATPVKSNTPPLPVKQKGSTHSKTSTPTGGCRSRLQGAGVRETRSADGTLKMISENGSEEAGVRRSSALSAVDRQPTSSSDSSSVVSSSVCNDEDLTRGDKIRKSLRKLMKIKKTSRPK